MERKGYVWAFGQMNIGYNPSSAPYCLGDLEPGFIWASVSSSIETTEVHLLSK